jgi:hypothetical protein
MIVEKVFFQKPEGDGNKAIDFRYGNPYTFFMVSFLYVTLTYNIIIIKHQHFQGPQANNRDSIYHTICQA